MVDLKSIINEIENLDFISKIDKQNLILVLLGIKPFTWVAIQANLILFREDKELFDKIVSFKDEELQKQIYKVPDKYVNKLINVLKKTSLKYKPPERIVEKEKTFTHKAGKRELEGVFNYEIVSVEVGESGFKIGHKRIGLKLGYPKCCSKQFKKLPNLLRKLSMFWGLLSKTGVKVPEDLFLINHIPCKLPYCDKTLKQAMEYTELLKKHSKDTYEATIKLIKKIIGRELKGVNDYFKFYIKNSKKTFLKYKNYFRPEVFDKLISYLEKEGLIK